MASQSFFCKFAARIDNITQLIIMETISNELLTVGIAEHGAELQSIMRGGREYLWHGDPSYWKRRSPVLFPIVGSVWDGRYRLGGHEYAMSQHGFARDMDFKCVANDGTEARFRLESSDESRRLFPCDFVLEIGYRLQGDTLQVLWQVDNPSAGGEVLHFQIGAHPAFNYKDYDPEADVQGYFRLDASGDVCDLSLIGEKGCLKQEKAELATDGGFLPITRNTFDGDALVLENSQVHCVELCDRQRRPYVKVGFEAPVVGLWSPARGGYAPFVCIEPWYGRCDREHFTGDFGEKDWMQHLQPGERFSVSYSITIL